MSSGLKFLASFRRASKAACRACSLRPLISLGVSVGILGDLRGPRIRVGEMQNGVIPLKSGNKIILSPEPIVGSPERIAVSFRGLANDVAHGTVICWTMAISNSRSLR